MLSILICPLLINIAYKTDAPCPALESEWSAGDSLAFYGNILTFIGTTCISIVALLQTKKIEEVNLKHTNDLEKLNLRLNSPYIIIQKYNYNTGYGLIEFELLNVTDNIAHAATISNICVQNSNDSQPRKLENKEYYNDILFFNVPWLIQLNEINEENVAFISFELCLEDRLNVKHRLFGQIKPGIKNSSTEYKLKEGDLIVHQTE